MAALVSEGLTNRDIAKRLFISERTVDGHLEHVREKLSVSSRAQIAAWYVEQGQAAPAPESGQRAAVEPRALVRPRIAVAAVLLVFAMVAGVLGYELTLAAKGPVITTLAGSTKPGTFHGGYTNDFGRATQAELYHPKGVAISREGFTYIADSFNHVVRMVDRDGIITTVAGGGNARPAEGLAGTSMALPQTTAIAVAADGSVLFCGGSWVFRLNREGVVHIVLGPSPKALVGDAAGLAADQDGTLYIADRAGQVVFRLLVDGSLSIYAGTGKAGFGGDKGPAAEAQLNLPTGLALDVKHNLFIADQANNRVRRVDHDSQTIDTVAGSHEIYGFSGDGGPAIAARLSFPSGVAVDNRGRLFIADTGNNRVRQVAPDTKLITTIAGIGKPGFAGDGSPAAGAALFGPYALALDLFGNLLVADAANNRIREVHLADKTQ